MRRLFPSSTTSELAARAAALRSAPFRRFWFGSLGSVGATQLLMLGLGWLVFRLTRSPLDLGLLGVAISAPTIVMAFFGGVLADQLDRRRLLMATSASVVVLLLLLAFLDHTERVALWQVLAIAVVMGLLTGIDWPARQAMFPSLVAREQIMSAVTLNSILWQGTRMTVPALGGVVIAAGGTASVFVIAAAGFLGMYLVLTKLTNGHTNRPQGISTSHLVEGIRFILRTRLFAVFIPLTWIVSFFGTSYLQLMPVYADVLDVAEQGYGALISTSGVGSMTGTLVVSAFHRTRHLGRVMLLLLMLAAVGLCLFGLVATFATTFPRAFEVALVCVFVIHFFVSSYLVASMTVLQLNVPDALRGRVMGIYSINFSLIPLGGIWGGSIASAFGPPAAVFTGAAVICVSVVVVALAQPMIRELDGRALTPRA